jgi:hypothetical protein
MKSVKSLIIILSVGVFLWSCSKDSSETHNEELITTLELKFIPQGGGNEMVYSFRDTDGPGGLPPQIDTIFLDAHQSYQFQTSVLNEAVHPAEDISEEIRAEAEAHRFYYISMHPNMSFGNFDEDENGAPLGLEGSVYVTNPFESNLRVVLKHYGGNPPNKQAGDPVDHAASSTDIDVIFPVKVQ